MFVGTLLISVIEKWSRCYCFVPKLLQQQLWHPKYTQRNMLEQTLLLLTQLFILLSQCRRCVKTELEVAGKASKWGGGKEKRLWNEKQLAERDKMTEIQERREGERNPRGGIKVERRMEGGGGGREWQRGWSLGWMELSGDWVNIFERKMRSVNCDCRETEREREREREQHVYLIFGRC